MATNQNDNFNIRAPKPIDNRWGVVESGVFRPFNDADEANELIVYRHRCLTVWILKDGVPTDYWYRDGIEDGNLIEKEYGSSYVFANGLSESDGEAVLGGTIDRTTTLALGSSGAYFLRMYPSGGLLANTNMSGGATGLMGLTGDNMFFGKSVGANQQGMRSGISHILTIIDDVNGKGLEEAADYSANKTQYSYVTKKMLDAVASDMGSYLPLSGGTMSGSINMGGGTNNITNAQQLRATNSVYAPNICAAEPSSYSTPLIRIFVNDGAMGLQWRRIGTEAYYNFGPINSSGTASGAGTVRFESPILEGSGTGTIKFELPLADNRSTGGGNPNVTVAQFKGSVLGRMDGTSDPDGYESQFATQEYVDAEISNIPVPSRDTDPSLNLATTSADMDFAHPTAAIGDIYYNVDGPSIYVATKMATGIWQIQQSGT